MRTAGKLVELAQATARPVLTIHIDNGKRIAAVRRHAPLTPQATRVMQDDFTRLFEQTRIDVVSTTSTRRTKATADRTPNGPSKGTQ